MRSMNQLSSMLGASVALLFSACAPGDHSSGPLDPAAYDDHHEQLSIEPLNYDGVGANRILFTRNKPGISGVVAVDGAANAGSVSFSPRAALWGWGDGLSAAPGGGRIAFWGEAPFGNKERSYDIFVRDIGGKDGTPLGGSTGANRFDPSWSPDGSSVIYAESITRGDHAVSIVMQPLTGGAREILWSAERSCETPGSPVVNASGTLAFVYISACDNSSAIAIKPKGATGLTFVKSIGLKGAPDWSPDGRRIAFLTMPLKTGEYVLNVVDADGSNASAYPLSIPVSVDFPGRVCWGADASRLFFANRESFPSAVGNGEGHIYSIRPDGTGLTRITSATQAVDAWVTCVR